jgi:hypothetical protein
LHMGCRNKFGMTDIFYSLYILVIPNLFRDLIDN